MQSVVSIRDGLIRTNPVWCLRQRAREFWSARDPVDAQRRLGAIAHEWEQQGIQLPRSTADEFFYLLPQLSTAHSNNPSPRIIGLVVNLDEQVGFVTPLHVTRSHHWSVAPTLPFRAGHVQDALLALLIATGRPIEDCVPELIGFTISEDLRQRSDGVSMDIAALLAVIDTLNGHSVAVLRCACAVVQPSRKSTFQPVRSIRDKLEAFIREYDRGSLLVRTSNSPDAAAFDERFETVWIVDDFEALARSLDEQRLLDELLKAHPLTMAEVVSARQRIRWLMNDQRNGDALEFAQRVSKCGSDATVPTRSYLEIGAAIEDLYRHLGKYQTAVEASTRVVDRLDEMRDMTCYQDRLDAQVRLAAALYDAHDFERMCELLEPWKQELSADPQRVSPDSRVMLFNTLARAMIILGKKGWQELLRQSMHASICPMIDRLRQQLTNSFVWTKRSAASCPCIIN